MSPLNQMESQWNFLCGLWAEVLNTVEHIMRILEGHWFCFSLIKINKSQIFQNKDHQRVPGELFLIKITEGFMH